MDASWLASDLRPLARGLPLSQFSHVVSGAVIFIFKSGLCRWFLNSLASACLEIAAGSELAAAHEAFPRPLTWELALERARKSSAATARGHFAARSRS